MPQLSWNEIRDNALKFSRRWSRAESEAQEKQTFWNEFFAVFGRDRKTFATFEEPVRNLRGRYGRIDLFWKGVVLVEHKSAGKDLSKAESQAFDYIQDLAREGRDEETPRFVIISDFARIALHDLAPEQPARPRPGDEDGMSSTVFSLDQLHKHVRDFGFIKGDRVVRLKPEDPANEKAYARMCQLHDELKSGGFAGADMERLLVRVLFCLFAEDTGVFEPNAFHSFVLQNTREDASDLGARLNELFDVLNTPIERRSRGLHEEIAGFQYVNGDLFAERIGFASFTRRMRAALLEAAAFQWARVSPAVFGSLFQGILLDSERRQQGAHYTTEANILKVIRSLFLDDLRIEFDTIRGDRSTRRKARLDEFQGKLRSLRFLDPACGCGNFLVIAYRELRSLELDVLRERRADDPQRVMDIREMVRVDVDQFYGIEIAAWPARIAEVALWLMDHQMNQIAAVEFGQSFQRLPLTTTPHIIEGNALRLDWRTVLPAQDCTYVLGNPPFVGKKERSAEQKADMALIWGGKSGAGNLDYVTCWYRKAAEYIQGTEIRVGFVSTNSIAQGEQVGALWGDLLRSYGIKIHFAHTTFAWQSEARGKAHVHVVIVGFGAFDTAKKTLFEYENPSSDPHATPVRNLNPYLADAPDVVIGTRTKPLNGAPDIRYGSMMIDKRRDAGDDEGLIITDDERQHLLRECADLRPYIRVLLGGDEFINGAQRWCLWLVDAPPTVLRRSPRLQARLERVRAFRLGSTRPQTKKLADTPALFGEIRQPSVPYLLIPKVSSESRRYIPIGFIEPDVIASGSALIVPGASPYDFGILSSAMHNAWMRYVGGRLESRYQYSNNIIYNNFPWPGEVDEKLRAAVRAAATEVLDARTPFLPPKGTSTLADLYDPLTMPAALVKAHAELDRAVDRCYRAQAFRSDRERVEHLFLLYERLVAPLLPATPRSRTRRGRAPRA
jgi:hypothetical protein